MVTWLFMTMQGLQRNHSPWEQKWKIYKMDIYKRSEKITDEGCVQSAEVGKSDESPPRNKSTEKPYPTDVKFKWKKTDQK